MTEYAFDQLVDIEKVRNLLNSHHALVGLTYAILDIDENILVSVGWQDICVRFHRVNPVSCASCRESDAYIKALLNNFEGDFIEYRCKNGMIDVAMPIIIDGEHVATFFSGQFFYEEDPPDKDFFRIQAEQLGFDLDQYLAALERVPIFSHEKVRSNMQFLCDMVKVLARIGLGNLNLRREVEEHRRTEDELHASEEAFRGLAENTRDLILRYDRNCRRSYVNPAVERFFGIPVAALQGKTPVEMMVLDPASNAIHMRCISEVLASGRALESEMSFQSPEGQMRYFLAGYAPEWGKNGEVANVLSTLRDITERKRSELEQQMNELRLSSLYQISQYPFPNETDFLDHALKEVINLTESRFGYIYFYDEQKRQFNLNSWSKDVMRECRIREKMTIHDLESTGIWGEAVRQKKPIVVNDFEAHHPLRKGCPEGHVVLKRFLTIPVIANDAIVAVVGVANKEFEYTNSDVMQLTLFMDSVWKMVDRKRMEESHLKLEKQLLHTQKLESLGVLAGGIAHDFNNILLAIIGNADLALMKISPESPATENLRKIEQAACRAADMSKQMLAYSGKGKFVIEQADLNRVLEEMLHMLEVSISKKITLRLNLTRPLSSIEADITQMHQVIMNLIINASEAIGDAGGVITISTSCVDCGTNYLNSIAPSEKLPEGRYVVLEVADTGCGMDQETMAKIFDPFFTTKFTGRGLGMAAVHGIIRGHKGAINVYSEPGKGSIFKVLLPASISLSSTQPVIVKKPAWRGIGTVLLVDDEEDVRSVGCEMLEALGFEALSASDGIDALEKIKQNPSIRIVILDLTMPRMDGEQAFNELRRLNPGIQVVMSSGYNEQEVTRKFVGKKMAGFIQKPYRVSALREVLSSLS